MVKERLFTEDGGYTDQAIDISLRLTRWIKELAEVYPEVDMRDLTLVVLNAAQLAAIDIVMDRKKG